MGGPFFIFVDSAILDTPAHGAPARKEKAQCPSSLNLK